MLLNIEAVTTPHAAVASTFGQERRGFFRLTVGCHLPNTLMEKKNNKNPCFTQPVPAEFIKEFMQNTFFIKQIYLFRCGR